MPKKSEFAMGLETILNNPKTNFLKNPKVFSEIHSQSKMPLSEMIRQVGRTSKKQGKGRREPTDAEKSEARLDKMEAKQNS